MDTHPVNTLPQTERSRLRRAHNRGSFDRATINAILDSQPMCTVGYVFDGKPYVTPTLQWREGNHVYWHGSSASRALKKGMDQEVCLSVAILDGFVMARSGFHHSLNTRSVTLFGTATKVPDEEKEQRLTTFIDQLWPGRPEILRPNNPQELKATTLLRLEISEGAAKVRTGPPGDDEEDYALPIWAGVIPVHTTIGTPIPDPRNLSDVPMPEHLLLSPFNR